MRAFSLLLLFALGAFSAGAFAQVRVFTGIAPEAYLIERVGGSHVSVDVLVGPGQNHHTYEPTPKQMADLAQASIYFSVDLPFEARLLEKIRAVNPALRCIDVREGVQLRMMEPDDDHAEPAGGGAQGAMDPHVWLNLMNAKIMAANICKGLQEIDPPNATEYGANLAVLQGEMDALDKRLAATLEPFKGQAFYVYHPAFGYFADAYGLRQVPIEIEGKEPTPKQLASLIAQARAQGVRVIFVQQQFPKRAAEAVAQEIGGAVVSIDPLSKDYVVNMERIAEEVRASLQTR